MTAESITLTPGIDAFFVNRSELSVSNQEMQVIVPDLPAPAPHATTEAILPARSGGQQASLGRPGVLAVCGVARVLADNQMDLFPFVYANAYFAEGTNAPSTERISAGHATVTIIRKPLHGIIEPDPTMLSASYVPDDGYLGKDSMVLEVRGDGYTIRIHYYALVTEDVHQNVNNDKACKGRPAWRVSLAPSQ